MTTFQFPIAELEWTELYQMTPYHAERTRERKIELMFRAPYPPIYRKSQMPLVSEISEVTVTVDDAWKVGDLVDWWTTNCYWSGRIMRLFGNCKAMLKLKQPPLSEGETYKVLLKDVRPSLDWSPDRGWTVPPQGGKNGRVCARIIEPRNQAHEVRQETVPGNKKDESEDRRTSRGSEVRRTLEQPQVPHKNHGAGGGVIQTQGSEDRRTSEKPPVPQKNHEAGGAVALNSVATDALEAAIMDLEELVNKVKWIQNILEHGVSLPDGVRPEWEFVDQSPASSAPK
ncbi:uncharacterized protein [Primulina huaijiensis]|uniref:uncharacterized protein isoform X2 n=1 Tax=Primulina huaijiensis TaxID=1492673 RepID=UPI003CC7153D